MNSFASLLRVSGLQGLPGGIFGSMRTLFTRPHLPSFAVNARPTSMYGLGSASVNQSESGLLSPTQGLLGGISCRTLIRNHFPKPSEVKRVKKHGWRTRMSTLSGRKTLMRRILKGRHVYSH